MMKLWISGEVDSIIGDSFRVARNYIEEQVNTILASENYGGGILSWDIIMIVSKDYSKESYKYNANKKDTDVYLVIDFDKFKSSNLSEKTILLFDSLIYCVDKLSSLKVPDFDHIQLKKDLLNLKAVIFDQHAN